MLISTLCLYFTTKYFLLNEVEEELRSTKSRVVTQLSKNPNSTFISPIIEVEKTEQMYAESLKDTLIFDPSQNEMEEFRSLTSFEDIQGTTYKITINSLIVETDTILIAIVISYLLILLVSFSSLFYFNKKKNEAIWRPFFENLNQMKQFALSSEQPITLIESDILEFTELNNEIQTLTTKVRSDYRNLKQFTEDVSHEMQTPLAIIQAKIENFINGESLTNEQFSNITSVQKDIQRLSQLNKKLVLISKIDNNQFTNEETVLINNVLEEVANEYQELTAVPIKIHTKATITVNIDPHLAWVLCSNLISNAVKYRAPNSEIELTVQKNHLTIANFGKQSLQEPTKIFRRYYRENNTLKSTGLGLTIVKKICDLHGFQVLYHYHKHQHIFKINFSETPKN